MCAAFYFVGWCVQKYLYDLPVEGFFKKALAVHVVSWVLQFVGHGVFESKRGLIQRGSLPCSTT